jgi:hypothetical protein
MASADITEDIEDARADETTALLAPPPPYDVRSQQHDSENGISDEVDDTPLPKIQIFLLCFARFIEPVAFFCIFPFINQMIFDTGEVAETDVGFYSGLIVRLSNAVYGFN